VTRDPLAAVTTIATPQTQPVPGRTDQVRNNAGGYAFGKDTWSKVEDFLILGTAGGTYYAGEDAHTEQNTDVLFRAVREDGRRVADLAADVSAGQPPRAVTSRGALFALAAVSALGDADGVQAVKHVFPRVARTTDHLSMFFGYRKQLKGKRTPQGTAPVASRALRSTLASWFLAADVHDVAFRACKARQRKTPAGEDFALRDALRIAHVRAGTGERRALLGWLAGNLSDQQAAGVLPVLDAFVTAQAAVTSDAAVRAVTELRVPWEFLPSQVLASAQVWEALASTVGMTALIRNLARMTRLGVLAPYAAANATVAARLTSAAALRKARVHPVDLWLAMRVYQSGRSQPVRTKPPQTWSPVAEISDALEDAWQTSFGHVEPSGKRLLVAVDSSGSMGATLTVGGSPLGSAYQAGCAMALMLKRTEGGNVHVIDVSTTARRSAVTARTNLRDIAAWAPGGGTDLSLPFSYASRHDLRVDGFAVLTDNETWAGRQHPFEALAAYRSRHNPGARVVVAAMTAAGHTIAGPGDPGVLNVAGMDASLPRVLAGFIR
jgi:60 kDa SS-A/Ro ribonucleoprotein